MKIIIATHNKHKLAEMARILEPMGYEVVTDRDLGIELTDVEENGKTFLDNARIKAEAGCRESGLPCIADDSGLCVDALGGEPGVYSARYAGEECNPQKNMEKLLSELEGIEQRAAAFVTCVALTLRGSEHIFMGEIAGEITKEAKGNAGFGYDPVFKPFGYDKTFAELGDDIKNSISHRAKAMEKLAQFLNNLID